MTLPSKGIPEKGITEYGAKIYNRMRRVILRVKDAAASARCFKVPADRLFEMLQDAIATEKPLPPYERGYVDGMVEALREEIWHRHVRWQLYLDGARVTSAEISAIADREEHEGKDRLATWARVQGRHEWISDPNRPFTDLSPACPRHVEAK